MIFYLYDALNKKINNTQIQHRRKPNKLKYIIIWLILIITVNIIFYYLGLFENSVNVPLKINTGFKRKSHLTVIPNNNSFRNIKSKNMIDMKKNNEFNKNIYDVMSKDNIIDIKKNSNFTKNIYDVVSKENINTIDNILKEVKNIPVPQSNDFDYYNFLNNI